MTIPIVFPANQKQSFKQVLDRLEIEGLRSNEAEVRFGVPQGSLLGPRRFSIYVNNLPDVPSGEKLEMFADDTTLYCIGDSVNDVCFKIQSSLVV